MAAPPFAFFSGPLPWLILAAATIVFLWVDLQFFARGREPSFREGVVWSIGWLVLSLLAAVVVLVLSDAEDAVTYTTVYFIERSLSLDNLFVFILLFSYFGVPEEHRARLLFWGIVAALVLRGLAILGGVALIEQFHFVIYVLGVLLLVLAYRILKGVAENVDPDKNLVVRAVRRVFPVTGEYHDGALVREARRHALRDAAVPLPGGDRRRRHRVRGRLDPGGVRDHARLGADLDGQRLRAARAARAVRARRGADPALPLPRRDDRGRARRRRRQAADRGHLQDRAGGLAGDRRALLRRSASSRR